MKLVVIGTGYVGLVSGACFADMGHNVICVDKDARKIKILEDGGIPIYEPGLGEVVARNRKAGRLLFTTSLKDALKGANAVLLKAESKAWLVTGGQQGPPFFSTTKSTARAPRSIRWGLFLSDPRTIVLSVADL
jgi:hypothetical protein